MPHVAALDGLRGLAVAAVVLFHTGASWMPGGFLGVSTFFTLSGFLITSLLIGEHRDHGTISLAGFWRRRVRRLLPVSGLTLVVVVLVAPVAWSALQIDRLGGDVSAAAFYVANWRFMFSGASYIDQFVAPSPVLHYWSLAIEEQFYVVFPLVAIWALRRGGITLLARVAAIGVVVSAALPLLLSLSPDRVYLGTDTRAAELLIGVLLAAVVGPAFGALRGEGPTARRIGVLGPLALVATVVAFVVVGREDAWLYRGGLAGFALVSAVLVAATVLPPSISPVARVLGVGPLVALGRISYGVYVIHWPLFQFLTEDRTGLDPLPLNVVRIGLTLVLAVASAALLELPIRRGRRVRDRVLLPAVPICAVAISVLAVVCTRPFVEQGEQISFAAEDAPPPTPPPTTAPAEAIPALAASDGTAEVLVVGGPATASLAGQITGWAEANAPQLHVEATLAPCGTTRAPIDVEFTTEQMTCAGWVEAWKPLLREQEPDMVVLLLPMEHTTMPAWGDRVWREEAQAVVDLLTSTGAAIVPVAVGATPLEGFDAVVPVVAGAKGADTGLLADLPAGEEAATVGRRLVELAEGGASRAAPADDTPRIMVVGDSLASNLGLALEQWAERSGSAVVWNAAALGCGIAAGGRTNATPPHDVDSDKCIEWRGSWAEGVDEFDPDIVVVLPSAWDLPGRSMPSWSGFKTIGDPEFDAWLTQEYQHAVDVFGGGGAEVVLAGLPCTGNVWTGFAIADTGAFDNDRIAELDELVQQLDGVQYVDLPAMVCPGGAFDGELGGTHDARPDGLHFSADAALWVADQLGPAVLDAAGVGGTEGADDATTGTAPGS